MPRGPRFPERININIVCNFHSQYGRFMFLQDILDCWPQWLIFIGIGATHTLLTFLLRVPGCPTGYLGPGGYHLRGKYANCTGGAAGYVDRLLFGSHMYNKTNNPIYGPTLRHDPEGMEHFSIKSSRRYPA